MLLVFAALFGSVMTALNIVGPRLYRRVIDELDENGNSMECPRVFGVPAFPLLAVWSVTYPKISCLDLGKWLPLPKRSLSGSVRSICNPK